MPSYRVFAPPAGLGDLGPGVIVTERYDAFVVVDAPAEAAAELRKRYPVEELQPAAELLPMPREEEAPGPRGRRDVVVHFRAPVRVSWPKKLEDLWATVQEPLGEQALVVFCPNKRVLVAVQGLE